MEEYHKFAFKKCGNELIHEYFDKFQVIPKFYDFYRAMWNSFQCESKYEVKRIEKTQNLRLSSDNHCSNMLEIKINAGIM